MSLLDIQSVLPINSNNFFFFFCKSGYIPNLMQGSQICQYTGAILHVLALLQPDLVHIEPLNHEYCTALQISSPRKPGLGLETSRGSILKVMVLDSWT